MYKYAFSVLCEIPYLKAGDDLTIVKKNLLLQLGFLFTSRRNRIILIFSELYELDEL